MSIPLENVRRDARMRMETDYELSPAWILVPLIPAVLGIVITVIFLSTLFTIISTIRPGGPPPPSAFVGLGAFLGLLGIIEIVGLIAVILFAYLVYKLINRRNRHFQRQGFLYDDLTTVVRELALKKGVDVSLSLNNMERTNREGRYEETEKSAVLFAILSVIPIVNIVIFYIYYFLMKDFYRHERREDAFLDDFNRALLSVGLTVNFPRRILPTPDRSFILYFILSLLTLGIFTIYWLYVLLTDPNSHFRQQAAIEDTILAQVAPIMA